MRRRDGAEEGARRMRVQYNEDEEMSTPKRVPGSPQSRPERRTRLDSTRLDSTRLDSTRLDSTRLDSTQDWRGRHRQQGRSENLKRQRRSDRFLPGRHCRSAVVLRRPEMLLPRAS